MTATAHPRLLASRSTPDPAALIEQARRRARRRRVSYGVVALGALAITTLVVMRQSSGGMPDQNRSPNGSGGRPAGTAPAATTGADRVVGFADLPRGWLEGLPRDVRRDSRIVGVIGGYRVAAAPTRNGNYCAAFGHVGGGCFVRDRTFSGSIGFLSLVGRTSVNVLEGSTTAPAGSRLYLRYADGTRERLPLTFVGQPIRAAFFGRTIPPARRTAETRPTVLELWLRGKLRARRRLPPGVPAAPA